MAHDPAHKANPAPGRGQAEEPSLTRQIVARDEGPALRAILLGRGHAFPAIGTILPVERAEAQDEKKESGAKEEEKSKGQ